LSNSFSNLFGLTQEALDACAREPIHIPGSVQPQGVVLIASPETLTITQVSINCGDFLGYEPARLLGQPLDMLFAPGDLLLIKQGLNDKPAGMVSAVTVAVSVRGINLPVVCLLHTYQGLLILELLAEEPSFAAADQLQYYPQAGVSTNGTTAQFDAVGDMARHIAYLGTNLLIDAPLELFCQQAAEYIRSYSGYDRVMVYQFDALGNGEVIAEARDEAYPPFLHLCYPAADIPPQARLLYLRNRVRALGDVYYQPVPLLPRQNPETGRDPDLSYTLLRSFSPVHLEYLHNMGVRATLTVSIIEQGRLWGLIACHHYAPKWPVYQLRLACDMFSQLISMQITMRVNYLRIQTTARAQRLQHELVRYLVNKTDWFAALADDDAKLVELVHADGAALCREGALVSLGITPPPAAIAEIVLWLQTTISNKVLVTDALSSLNPAFVPFAATASGLIALEVARNEGCYLLWFRKERIQTVTWGGNPAEKQQTVDGATRLRPRASFAAWQTEMRGKSQPWPDETQYLIEALRAILVEIVFELLAKRHTLATLDLLRVRRAVEAISEPLAITDGHGHTLFINAALAQLLGYNLQYIQEHGDLEALVVNPQDAQAIRQTSEVLTQSWQREIEVSIHDGSTIPVLLRLDPIVDATGQLIGQVRLYTDLRIRRRAEEERRRLDEQIFQTQKLESLGILAGGIAHDFNNLLTAMLGHANLALHDLPPESPARESVRQIEIAAQRAAELSNQMLAYSGRGHFVVQPINLNTLVTEIAHLLNTAISKSAVLTFALAAKLPAVEADATQLRQVVMNLITNASDAIGEASGTITLTTRMVVADTAFLATFTSAKELKPGRYVLLEVSDTGSGMDSATASRIFEPFFTTKFTGRGLGLAAVQGIVYGHRGALQVQSQAGQGTHFRVLLPAVVAKLAEQRQVAELKPIGSGEAILVVDDEQGVREFVQRVLERGGFRVLLADRGSLAVELFQQHCNEIKAVLLDLTMPLMSGREVYQALRTLKSDVPIILCSGYMLEEAVLHFAQQELAGFVQKPFRATELLQVLSRLL
jgi:PAS domain S-box-containing protein